MTSFWRNRPVLVTGASGLLGSYMVPELAVRGAEVVALVRDSVPKSILFRDGWTSKVVCVRGSITDASAMRRIMAEYSIETVFHLGAQTLVGVAQKDPIGTLEANIAGTWNVLEAARQTGSPQVLLASSDKAYGHSDVMPYQEDFALRGTAPYEVSKSCADLIATMYAKTYNIPVAIARCGNLFGGGDLNFSRLIPGVIQSTLRNEPFVIRSDGKYVRDFLYVEDAVHGYLTLAEELAGGSVVHGDAFNFGLELRLTMIDLTEKVLRMMGREDLRPVIQNTARAEIREQYLSAAKARTQLGWSPRFGLDAGLDLTIQWYREFPSEQVPVHALAVGA